MEKWIVDLQVSKSKLVEADDMTQRAAIQRCTTAVASCDDIETIDDLTPGAAIFFEKLAKVLP